MVFFALINTTGRWVYGPLRNLIETELSDKWAKYRDQRIVNYDDTLEVLSKSGVFTHIERIIFPNIIELTPTELALFFLSTSYVTQYMDAIGTQAYHQDFLDKVLTASHDEKIKVNFDIHAYLGIKREMQSR